MNSNNQKRWLALIIFLIIIISIFHYNTPTSKPHYHLIYMQAYFIPIILAAFIFGKRGGLGSAIIISIIYFPHIMLQWGGLILDNMMRFVQIFLFNIIGYITGLKAQGEREEKERYQKTAEDLAQVMEKQKKQSEMISDMEQQLRASDRLATIGELVAGLAHEVRNPLGSIRGAVEIIRETVPDEIKKLEFFDILVQDTQRLNEVVENYLSFAKNKPTIFENYDLQDTIRKIILMLEIRARKSNIKFKTEYIDKMLITKGDPILFWQTMMNITLNAMQAMPEGGTITLAVSEIQKKPDESPGQLEKIFAQISIKDEGKGIDKKEMDNIFKPFYTTKPDGTGLGLAIVKRIADENQWNINLKSHRGEGMEFIVQIPVEDDFNK